MSFEENCLVFKSILEPTYLFYFKKPSEKTELRKPKDQEASTNRSFRTVQRDGKANDFSHLKKCRQ